MDNSLVKKPYTYSLNQIHRLTIFLTADKVWSHLHQRYKSLPVHGFDYTEYSRWICKGFPLIKKVHILSKHIQLPRIYFTYQQWPLFRLWWLQGQHLVVIHDRQQPQSVWMEQTSALLWASQILPSSTSLFLLPTFLFQSHGL